MNISHKQTTTLLYACIILFITPFLFGMVFVCLAAIGVTPTWEVVKISLDGFKIIQELQYTTQVLLAIIRANIIGVVVFFLVFIFGYLLSINFNNKYVKVCMYFLSIPHVSLALGFSILIMPSGILFRLLALFQNTNTVGNITLINDSLGISMSIVVILKLVSFVLFMLLAGLQDYHLQYQILQSKLLGHNRFMTWLYIVFPQLMPKIFVPLLISIAYAISPIDIASILGPKFPSAIGMTIRELMNQAYREDFVYAQALCIILCGLSILSLVLWYVIFRGIRKLLRWGYGNSQRYQLSDTRVFTLAKSHFILVTSVIVLSTIMLLLWSFVIRWDFPTLIPTRMGILQQLPYLTRFTGAIQNTFIIAMLSTILSIVISILILELLNTLRWKHQFFVLAILLLPLLLPSIVYITGVHIFFLYLGINGSLFSMVWAHSLKAAPYITLLLYGVFKNHNPYFMLQAKVLGKSYLKALMTVKIPMIIIPISYAMLIGMMVSVAEYVYTQFIGEGKWETVTTLSIALYSGGNRQIMSISGVLLTVLNLVIISVGICLERMQKGLRKVNL